jgi:integrase
MGKAKKPTLRLLPADWREALWEEASQPQWRQSRPQLLPALAVLWLSGCRSAELAAGALVIVRGDRLAIRIRGAKCVDAGGRERGQPTRTLGFAIDADANPALKFLQAQALAGRDAIDGTAQLTITHDKDYLYNSLVQLGKSTFPKLRTRVSPNCFRHQVASDMKADPDVSLEHAAKVMGHLSDYSIGRYGHAAHGRKGRGGRVTAPFVQTARPIKHSPKVDRLARFKIASAKRRDQKPG